MEVIETTVFTFDELSDEAKEKARDWYREGGLDYEWWDSVFYDATEIGKLMGIEIDNIFFSGFWSQGDGAQFTGQYAYVKGAVKAVKAYAPLDETLHQIARDLQAVQRKYFYRLSANVESSGHYSHEYCTRIAVHDSGPCGPDAAIPAEEGIQEALRDFMRWIYRQLEREYEYLNSDEAVDETIEANEYTFTESGRRFG